MPKTHFYEKINFTVSDLATYRALRESFLISPTIACGINVHSAYQFKTLQF